MNQWRVPWRMLLFAVSSLVLTLSSNSAKSQDEGTTAGLKVFGGTQTIITLARQGKQLSVGYSEDVRDYQPLINVLRRELSGGSSSSSRGGGGWLTKISGPAGLFAIVYGNRTFPGTGEIPESNGGLGVLFQQNGEPFNELSVSAGPDNKTLKLQLMRPADDLLFCFEQTETGVVQCKLLNGSEVLSIQAPDYESLVREHWEVINSTVSPILLECGVAPPLNRYTKPVWTQFLLALRPVDGALQREFDTLLDRLDSTKFADREKATVQLTQQFEKWQRMIGNSVSDSTRSVECRSRLAKIQVEFATPVQQQARNVLDALDLESDALYLIWLASRLQGESVWEKDQGLVFKQLGTLTGKKYGDDLNQWIDYGKTIGVPVARKVDTSTFQSTIDLTQLEGAMGSARDSVRGLLPLRVHEGKLELDRGVWLELFGQKTPEELIDEVGSVLEKNNLPLNWLRPSGIYMQETVGYPQILFQSLRLGLEDGKTPGKPVSRGYRRLSRRSLNREFDGVDAKAALRLHKPIAENRRGLIVVNGRITNTVAIKDFPARTEEFVFFEFTEKKDAGRKLVFKETKDGSLSISLNVDRRSSLLRYVQRVKPDGSLFCSFQDLRGGDVFVASADSFGKLIAGNRAYYEQHWQPVFESVGLEFPDP